MSGPSPAPPLIILGGGGHAKVVIEALLQGGRTVLGRTDGDPAAADCLGVPVLGDDRTVLEHDLEDVRLVNGIGATGDGTARRDLFAAFRSQGYRFAEVLHPAATVARDVVLEEGAQIMAGAVLQPGCRIGANAIVNTGARVDHDCVIGAHAHIAPGAVLCGGVRVGAGSHIGAGATVIQYLEIGPGCLVAAGAVVVASVPAGTKVAGVPARTMGGR